jgi:transmembrane sensor
VTLAAETLLFIEQRKDRRGVRLERGEAYFEVAHDADRPFVVRAYGHDVVAVGTAFDVEAKTDRMTVTVTQGIVGLRGSDPRDSDATSVSNVSELRLAVGERATADGGGVHRLTAVPRPEAVAAWRDGRLEYLHASLQVVIDDVNRYTDRKIVVADPFVGSLQFTGTVILDDLGAWLAALPVTFPVEIVDRGAERVLQHTATRSTEPQSALHSAVKPRS